MRNSKRDSILPSQNAERWLQAWARILRFLMGCLDEIHQDYAEIREALQEPDRIIRWRRLNPRLAWGQLYESSFKRQFVGTMLKILPLTAGHDAVSELKPPSGISSTKVYGLLERVGLRTSLSLIAPAAFALERNIQALIIDQVTINQLVDRVRTNSDDKAFLLAVGFDPMALTARPMQDRLALAVLKSDKKFLEKLGNVIANPRKPERDRDKARLNGALLCMHLAGQLHKLRPDTAYQLFAVELKLYPVSTKNKDQLPSLWRHVERKRKLYATKIPRILSVMKN